MEEYPCRYARIKAHEWFPDETVGIGYDRYGVEYYFSGYNYKTVTGLTRIEPGDFIVYPEAAFSFICPREAFRDLFITEKSQHDFAS